MSSAREDILKSIVPQYPGWHRNTCLPFLIPLANSVDQTDHAGAIQRLLIETLVWTPRTSRHDLLRIHAAIAAISYSDGEMRKAVVQVENESKSGRTSYGSALSVGLAGDGATPRTLEILTLISKALVPLT